MSALQPTTASPNLGAAWLLDSIAELRAAAWGHTARSDIAAWLDEWDATAHHHIIVREGKIAAAVRFTLHEVHDDVPYRSIYGDLIKELPTPIAWYSRLVVSPEWRGKGISKALDWLAANEPFNMGANSIVATGGSVAENQFRHEVMLNHGWSYLGQALGLIDLPLKNAKPPAVYARQRVAE